MIINESSSWFNDYDVFRNTNIFILVGFSLFLFFSTINSNVRKSFSEKMDLVGTQRYLKDNFLNLENFYYLSKFHVGSYYYHV